MLIGMDLLNTGLERQALANAHTLYSHMYCREKESHKAYWHTSFIHGTQKARVYVSTSIPCIRTYYGNKCFLPLVTHNRPCMIYHLYIDHLTKVGAAEIDPDIFGVNLIKSRLVIRSIH